MCELQRRSFIVFSRLSNLATRKGDHGLENKNKISYPEARRVVSSRTPVAGKSYASATSKSYVSTAIQRDASTAPTSATAASITPKNVAVDTLKSVSPPRDVKKKRKTRIKESGVQSHKKRGRTSLKNSMTWETMSWTFTPRKATKCVVIIVYDDVDGDTSPTGGVCLFTSNLYPSTVVTLHTSLQAVAVRIHVHSLVTVCCVYLPPNDVVPQVDLNHLVSQLPAPFIWLGDFNGHSPLWGHDVTNSRGRQPVVFQRVFAYHRSQYSRYSAIYTDGSKRADYVGCGVVIEDIMHGYRLDTFAAFSPQGLTFFR
ncbi:putative RNA-directed DNA polymerase from transposon X-element [Trichonephila clavipes]|nr:putative RNA-directed DNA polymerase from transposon X-element [Trichonephila clavipes]